LTGRARAAWGRGFVSALFSEDEPRTRWENRRFQEITNKVLLSIITEVKKGYFRRGTDVLHGGIGRRR